MWLFLNDRSNKARCFIFFSERYSSLEGKSHSQEEILTTEFFKMYRASNICLTLLTAYNSCYRHD